MEHQEDPSGSAPAFSVVMAVFNGSATLAAAVGSVQAQTLTDWELLVVDDASTDGSAELVRGLARADARIRLLSSPGNSGGPARPRNLGLREARGATVCLLDQDDRWAPGKLAAQADKLASGDFGLVYSDALVERPGQPTELYSRLWGPMAEGYVGAALLAGCFIPALTVAVPRAVVTETGAFDESLSGVDDYDYWLRIVLAGRAVGLVDEPLATWVVGTSSLSHRHAQQLDRLARCLAAHGAAHPEHQDLVARRVAETRQQLWRLDVERYVHDGGLTALMRRVRNRQQARDVVRAVLIRHAALYGRLSRSTHGEAGGPRK